MKQRDEPPLDVAGLVGVLYGDLCGLVRGKAVPGARLRRVIDEGIGWVPANLALDPFDRIAPNPWGPVGRLELCPDASTFTRVARPDGLSAMQIVLADIRVPTGEPWEGCPRSLLRSVLDRLKAMTGCELVASFEHEFWMTDGEHGVTPAFSFAGVAQAEPFATAVMTALEDAGLDPEMFIREFGRDQYEIPCGASDGVRAADRALILREVVRDVARMHRKRVSFSPLLPDGNVSNGVHIHFSLVDGDGRNVVGDASADRGLTAVATRFAAGVLKHAPAICALTAPSPVSYARLTPGRWGAGYIACGREIRETALRVIGDAARDEAVHLEYRAVDATANPYLALAALVVAGMEGIESDRSVLPWLDDDPSGGESAERSRDAFPQSLAEALESFSSDREVSGLLPEALRSTYRAIKSEELAHFETLPFAEAAGRYRDVY